ncbi:MAG: twin-arginine translocase subunit TatC [Planctomycetota bacterium]|jgi:sec-independent protein translocase protein TatC
MRRLDVLFTPAETGSGMPRGKLVFPVDVLRFSTCAAQAVASGANALFPFESLPSLNRFAATLDPDRRITAGERDGIPIPDLDLGNSPQAFTPEACEGKDVLMVTTNGTRTLKAVEGGGLVLPFGFVNLSAVAAFAAPVEGEGVVVCSGWKGNFALEDALAAGAFVVESLRLSPDLELTESARAARDLAIRAGGRVEAQILDSEAARRLTALGFEEDVAFCLSRDTLPVVMELVGKPPRIVARRVRGEGPEKDAAPAAPSQAPAAGKPESPTERKPPPPPPPRKAGTPADPAEPPKGEAGGRDRSRRFFGLDRKAVDAFRMPLAEHLAELRRRILYCLFFALLGFVVVFIFRKPVIEVILVPVQKAFTAVEEVWAEQRVKEGGSSEEEGGAQQRPWLIANAVQEKFMAQIKIALAVGVFLASPLIFWQLWLFVGAGLYPWERKWIYIFAPATYLCFSGGVLFLYFIVLPLGLRFLLGFGYHAMVLPTMGYAAYVSFFLLLSVVMGLVFELPLVMLFLARLGLVAPQTFASKRKYFIVSIFVCSALITPPDVITQVLVALPLLVLYEVGILLARFVYRKREAA